MIAPKKTKYRTSFVRKVDNGKAAKGIDLQYGEVGIISLKNAFITPNQIEAARRVIAHTTKRSGKLWIRIFPDQPMTSKPANVRMGSGKGPLKEYVAHVRAGRVIFEIGGINRELASTALIKAAKKLPVPIKIITR
ncbi:MAG: 50S ribosomal protein L16 [Candidatus Dojkabacteria bacterium]